MQIGAVLPLVLATCWQVGRADSTTSNPLGKVLDLLGELEAKVKKEGEVEAAAYKEFLEWCDNANRDANNAITTATATKGKLEAKIAALSGDIEASTSKIEELAGATASSGKELKDATAVRGKEAKDFMAAEKELMDIIDTLDRAISILDKEMSKNPASFSQLNTANTKSLLQSLSAVIDAAGISVQDQKRLLALVQSQDADEDLGAPAAAVYKTHSSNIFDVLEDLKAKAEAQLADLRKAESNARHNYDLLKQSLEDQSAADTKDMEQEKASKAQSEESKAGAQGDLTLTSEKLANAEESLSTTRANCMRTAADHQATVAARTEELKVIAEAMEILKSTTSGAVSQTYSLLQLESGQKMQTHADLAASEVVVLVKKLAREHHSAALAQLASQVAAIMKYGSASGEDPFAKVKSLIRGLIDTLEAEAHSEATEKAYCDEEMAKTETKKGELDDTIAKLTVKIDQAAARSADLKEQVKELQLELAALAKLQAEMDKIRQETHADYVEAKADLELGVSGVTKALGILRDYYAAGSSLVQQAQPAVPQHSKASGAGTSIIGILEVVESDFATNLAKEETEEEDAQAEYEKVTQENKVSKELKDQDVKYKTQEIKQLSESLAELSSDREAASTELSAVLDYYAKIKERCIAKPETYEKRQERRQAEIKGLREALDILENEAALIQRKRRGHVRGALEPH